jgi:hypothetical protein
MTDSTSTPSPSAPQIEVRVNDGSNHVVSVQDVSPKFSGIFEGAMTKTGFPANELTPDTLIKLPMPSGAIMEGVTLAQAERVGMVARDKDGNYYEVQQGQQPEAPRDPDREQVTLPDQKAEQYLGDLHQACVDVGVDPQSLVLELIADPTRTPKVLEKIAQHHNAPHDAVVATYKHVLTSAFQQAHATVREMGIADSTAFFDWAEATHPTETKGAYMRHFAGRLDGYRQLARRYMDAKGIRGATTGQAKVTVLGIREVPGGRKVVTVRTANGNNIEVSEGNARLQGWIR